MKKSLPLIAIGLLTYSTLSSAATTATPPHTWLDNVSGTFDFTTNYMFRGISQSQNNPAVQGGLTYTFPIGIYANLWGSNVHFTAPNGQTATAEFDTIIGWNRDVTDYLNINIDIDRYNYPAARYANYNELNTLWALYKIFTLGVSYTSNFSGTHGSGTYVNGTLSHAIPAKYIYCVEGVSVAAEMGHYSLARQAGNSYNDYSLTLNKAISDKYTISAMWSGTNGRAKQPPYDNNQFIGTVTATF